MKKLLPLIILVFAVKAFGQTKTPNVFETEYNKFNDETRISSDLWELRTSKNQPVTMTVSLEHPGKTLTKDVSEFWFLFDAKCSRYFCFSRDEELVFLVDDVRLKIADTVSSAGDTAIFTIKRSEMERLASAKTLEFQISIFQIALKPKDIANLKILFDLGTAKK